MNPNSSPGRGGKVFRTLLLFVGGPLLLLLIAIPVVAMTVDIGGVVRNQLLAQKPQWEQQLGRPIGFGAVQLRLLPGIAAEVRDLQIGAAPGGTGVAATPLARLQAVRLGVEVWPLLRGEVRVKHIEVAGLEITVVRGADGRLSYEDVLERLGSDDQPKKPLTPEQLDYLGRLSLSHLSLQHAALRFYDLSVVPLTSVAIDQLDVTAKDLALGRPFTVQLDAAALSPTRNVSLTLDLNGVPRDLQVAAPAQLLRKLKLRVLPLQLEPLLRFLPPAELALHRALLDCDFTVEAPAAAGQLRVAGYLALAGLTLAHHLPGSTAVDAAHLGTPTDLRVQTDLTFALLAGDLSLKQLELALGAMGVSGQAELRALWESPKVQSLALRSKGLTLEGLLAVLPRSRLPKDAVLRGPLSLGASGSGTAAEARVEAELDLTPATVLLPSLHKPAGTALAAGFRGTLRGGAGGQAQADIERLGLTLGPLKLLISGTAQSGGDVDLKLSTGAVDLDRLLRLLPQVQRSIPESTHLDGDVQVAGKVQRRGGVLTADARVALQGANLETEDLSLKGGALLTADLRASEGAAAVQAKVDLSGARLRVPGTVDKAGGVPMRLELAAEQRGERVAIRTAELQLPGGLVRASGTMTRPHKGPGAVDVKVPTIDLELGPLSQTVIALRKSLTPGLRDATLKMAAELSGDPGNLRAKLTLHSLRASGGTLRGQAEVAGLSDPRQASFDFSGDGLDLDRLAGTEGKGEDKAEDKPQKAGAAPTVPLVLKKLQLDGKLHLTNSRYGGAAVRDLLLEVTLRGGKLELRTLRGAAFGGQVSASGSTVDFAASPPRFDLKAEMTKVEIAEVLALRGGGGGGATKLSGKGNVSLSAKGAGLAYEQIAPAVSGTVSMGLHDGRLHTTSMAARVLNPILERLQEKVGARKVKEEMALDELNARFQIQSGRMSTTAPMQIKSNEGNLSLSGSVGLDQSLALSGDLALSPQLIQSATQGRITPAGPIPVTLRVGGTLKAPTIEVVGLERTVAALAGAALKGRAKGLLDKLPGGAGGPLGGAVGGAVGAVADPAEAQRKLQEEAQRRLQEEAQRQKEEAKRRLEEEAKKRLGGGLKGLFGGGN